MKALYPLLFSLTLPIVPLLIVAVASAYFEKKLPFGTELEQAEVKVFWGEALFRLLWSFLFFDLIPAWLFFRYRPQFFSSFWVTALFVPAFVFVLGYLPLAVLLSSRFNFNWGYLFFTLFWIFLAFALSLAAIQIAYRI